MDRLTSDEKELRPILDAKDIKSAIEEAEELTGASGFFRVF
ncbi:hypothetical protein HRED_06108 [Candidatus Haloredivivus sp. G17]|nr:hypothetical protein HRED_06108 [Candidatus Haloredivivus sp. G17]